LLAQPQSRADADLLLAENAFGESIAVTPLQMVTAYGALANGGVLMRPYIVASVTGDGGQGAVTRTGSHAVRQVVSAATAQTVTQMLVQSAYRSEAEMYRVQGYTVAAKTGTSTPDAAHPQVTYASVIGYAPASNPRFVMLVKLDHPRETIYGGTAAGPLWRSLAQQLFVYYQIPPDAGTAGG
ncbi:MAG: penicillin-binding transpeptidase domain-containing protein, partial [Ktedonobacterales bacterium]